MSIVQFWLTSSPEESVEDSLFKAKLFSVSFLLLKLAEKNILHQEEKPRFFLSLIFMHIYAGRHTREEKNVWELQW